MKYKKKSSGFANERVLSVRIPERLFDILQKEADEKKMSLAVMVRKYLTLLVFPEILGEYIINFAETIKNIDAVSPEEMAEGYKIYEQFCDGVLKAFETARVAENLIKESRIKDNSNKFKFSMNFAKMMEAWKHSRKNVEQIEA